MVVTSAVGVPPADAAAVPIPTTPIFTRLIDPLAGYQPAATCQPTDKPGPLALKATLAATYGSRSFGISRTCSGTSEHNEGRALDWMISATDPAQRAVADRFLSWLLATDGYGNTYAMARRMGIMYVIWNRQIWRAYAADRGWQAYTGSVPHTDHVHFSLSWDGALARTSYWSGRVPCAVPGPPGTAPGLPTEPTASIPVAPLTLVNTATGAGRSDGLPCSLVAGGRVDVPVLGRGEVPASGVAAVDLLVTLGRSDRPLSVRVGPTGAAWSGSGVVPGEPTIPGQSLVTVPVGAGGQVSLTVDTGMTDLAVDVVGYHPAPGAAGTGYVAVPDRTVLHTARTGMLQVGERRVVDVAGLAGLPADAVEGVLVSVTGVSDPGTRTYVSVVPAGEGAAPAAWVNAPLGRVRTTTMVVRTDQAGRIEVVNGSRTAMGVVVDLHGYFTSGTSSVEPARFVPLPPAQLADSRIGAGLVGALGAYGRATVPVVGLAGVPTSGARAVAVNLSTYAPTEKTYVAAWPSAAAQPPVAWRYAGPLGRTGDLVVLPIDGSGAISLFNLRGTIDLRLEVVGYFR